MQELLGYSGEGFFSSEIVVRTYMTGLEHGLHLPVGAPVLRCPVRPVFDT